MVFVCFCYPLKTNKGSTITRKTFDFHLFKLGAEDGTQTRDPQLGRFKRFTYESNCYAFLYAECLFLSFVYATSSNVFSLGYKRLNCWTGKKVVLSRWADSTMLS